MRVLRRASEPVRGSDGDLVRSVGAVYDVLGRRVALLHEGMLGAGRHAFGLDGGALPAGVYVVRVGVEPAEGPARTYTHRLTVVE